jgi:hypothetical protein
MTRAINNNLVFDVLVLVVFIYMFIDSDKLFSFRVIMK